jgi:hypothetical protein
VGPRHQEEREKENEILTVRAEHLGQEMRPRVFRAEKVRAEK